MASTKSMALALKTLLILLLCVMIAAFVYVTAIGGISSCFDWTSRWDLAMVTDFSIYAVVLGAWYFYKESSWIKTVIFFVLMQTIGSVATIPYIIFQFYKLSPEESAKDPLYFVLARHHKRWDLAMVTDFSIYAVVLGAWYFYKESSWIKTVIFFVLMQTIGSVATIPYIIFQFYKLSPEESAKDPLYFVLARHHKREHTQGTSVATARKLFSALGCLMLGVLIYTLIMDIYAYHGEAFSMCFLTYMVDIYIHAILISVWIAYKESSWISASLWILSLVILGSITLCVYIVRQLLYLSSEQPVSLIIFKSNDKDMQSTDPLFMPQANV